MLGVPHATGTEDHINANTADTWYALIGLRLKSTHLGFSIDTVAMHILSETSDDFEWALFLNPTVAGTFTYADHDSAVQLAIGDTVGNPSANTVTIGSAHAIARGFGSGSSTETGLAPLTLLKLGAAIDGTRDEIVMCVRPLGSNADYQGSIVWREVG